jgi:succinoglycan biosynthesis transport protein ExoP
MGLRRLLSIASAHRVRLIAIPTLLGLLALAVSFALPSQYVATTTVRVISGDPVVPSAAGVVAILRSREVADMTAAKIAADQLPGVQGIDAFRGQVGSALTSIWDMARYGYLTSKPSDETAVDRARDALTVTVLPGGDYVQVSAIAQDPATAAAIANGAVDALIDRSAELRVSAAAEGINFFGARVAEAKSRADAARSAVLGYSVKNDAVPNESVRVAAADLDSARGSLRDIDLATTEAQGRLAEVQSQLATTPVQTITTTQTGSTPDSLTTTTTAAPNPVYLNLRDRVNSLRQDLAALQTRRITAQANVATSEDALRAVMAHDSELATLNQELVIADDQYAAASRDLAAARSDAARSAPPIQQVGRAPAPEYPSYPVRVAFLGAGLAAGLAISFLMTLILMATDRTLRSAADVMAVLEDLPLLAMVASNPRPNRREVAGS